MKKTTTSNPLKFFNDAKVAREKSFKKALPKAQYGRFFQGPLTEANIKKLDTSYPSTVPVKIPFAPNKAELIRGFNRFENGEPISDEQREREGREIQENRMRNQNALFKKGKTPMQKGGSVKSNEKRPSYMEPTREYADPKMNPNYNSNPPASSNFSGPQALPARMAAMKQKKGGSVKPLITAQLGIIAKTIKGAVKGGKIAFKAARKKTGAAKSKKFGEFGQYNRASDMRRSDNYRAGRGYTDPIGDRDDANNIKLIGLGAGILGGGALMVANRKSAKSKKLIINKKTTKNK